MIGDAFAFEPPNNGGYIDLGAYGNTSEASRSPAEYVNVLSPLGSQNWFTNRPLSIRWRSQDFQDTVTIELLRASGGTPLVITSSAPNTGSFVWTVPANQTQANDYLIRITRNSGANAVGLSPSPFMITPPVNIFYVNDATVTAGDWTTSAGNDANSGLSPAEPKASLAAILALPTVGPGSVVRVDSGTYNLTSNLIITAASAGITIEGFNDPTQPSKFALVNRGSTTSTSYVMELRNADNLTIKNLRLTGGYYGIFTSNTSDSDNVTIRDSWIYNNAFGGILLDITNDNPSVIGNTLFGSKTSAISGSQLQGITLNGLNVGVYDNVISDSDTAINVTSTGLVARNLVVNNLVGISASTSNSTTGNVIIEDNSVSGNQRYGIDSNGARITIRQNQVVGNMAAGANSGVSTGIGIRTSNSFVASNIIADNIVGLDQAGGTAEGNQVYGNLNKGIVVKNATVQTNRVFDNAIGISAESTASSSILNNIVYENQQVGIDVSVSNVSIENNSVAHVSGNAVRVTGTNTSNTRLRNNILSIDTGHAINVAGTSQVGFTSDFNLIQQNGTAKTYLWGSSEFPNQPQTVFGLGFESHSVFADPQWINPPGNDGVRGFSTVTTGPAVYRDETTAVRSGTWNSVTSPTAFGGSYLTNTIGIGDDALTWSFSNLTPGRLTRWPYRSLPMHRLARFSPIKYMMLAGSSRRLRPPHSRPLMRLSKRVSPIDVWVSLLLRRQPLKSV